MTEELKALQKEINGKIVWWRSQYDFLLRAICLWEPKGNAISVKPYGHTPEEIQKVAFWETLDEIKHPTHCLTSIERVHSNHNAMRHIKDIANVPDGCVYDPFEVEGGDEPSCPYGG